MVAAMRSRKPLTRENVLWGRSGLNRRPTDYEVIVWGAGGR